MHRNLVGVVMAAAVIFALRILPGALAQRGGPLSDSGPRGGRDPKKLAALAQSAAALKADVLLFKANATAEIEAAVNKDLSQAWADYKNYWSRTYGDNETETKHFNAFVNTLKFIDAYNKNGTFNNEFAAFMMLGPLADALPEEIARLNGILPDAQTGADEIRAVQQTPSTSSSSSQLPAASVNWVAAGKVSPIQNQQQCGSCWAFAATAVVESVAAIQQGNNATSLSEQQIIDCTPSRFLGNGGPTANGCDGASQLITGLLFPYAWQGMAAYQAYPYTATAGTCQDAISEHINITTTGWIPSQNQTALMLAVQQAPVIVGISASSPAFQNYGGGIMSDFAGCLSCYNTNTGAPYTCKVDHAVAIVGYDQNEGYWIIRNSWGPDWGIGGYMLLAMGTNGGQYPNGACNILSESPVAASVISSGQPVPAFYQSTLVPPQVVDARLFGGDAATTPMRPTLPPAPPPSPPPPPKDGGAAGVVVMPWHYALTAALLAMAVLMG